MIDPQDMTGPPTWEVYWAWMKNFDPHGITEEYQEVDRVVVDGDNLYAGYSVARKYGFQLPQWFKDRFQWLT